MKANIILSIAVGALLGFTGGHMCSRNDPGEPVAPKVDTLVIRDTFKVVEPKIVTKVRTEYVTYHVTDTQIVTKNDTLYVVMARDQIRWEDSLAVVYASGVDPQVDSVIHYAQSTIITKEIPVIQVKKTRWGIGVQAGYGADKNGLSPFVGVGVSYNLLSW